MTIGDRTVTFDVSTFVATDNNLAHTYEAHSPASGQLVEQLRVFVTASGDGVTAHDYICGSPTSPMVTVVDLGVEYGADATKGMCVLTVNGDEGSGLMKIDLTATVVSAMNESVMLEAYIAASTEGQ